jgi:cytochrome c oxidase accessory protein FixG
MTTEDKTKSSSQLSAQERIERLLQAENIIPERTPSLDSQGHKLDIFPAQVRGVYRKYRNWVYLFLLFVFLILPWTRFAGQQTIHLNISARKFIFFGNTLFAHDGPFIFLIFGMIVFSLALATAWYGRVWCGWACPQTVFIDTIYRRLEEWIEGNHIARKRLQESPWSTNKVLKKSLKWTLYIIVSIHIAHSFFAYFVGSKELLKISLQSPFDNLSLFIAVYVVSFLTLINFGWFREQFCIVACPYGRLQAALMDEKSISVFYDPLRGEPRRDKAKVAQGQTDYGDCVNCFKCVAVCPTGIDIRNGLQLECIACTACIDACDEVMEKIKKPKGLIRYASEREIKTGKPQSKKMGLRAKIYAGVVLGLFITLVVVLFLREDISVKALRAIEAPYQLVTSAEGSKQVINHYKLHITNQSKADIKIQELMIRDPRFEVISPNLKTEVNVASNAWVHVFIKFSPDVLKAQNGKVKVPWILNFEQKGEMKQKRGVFNLIGPE